LVLPKFRPRRIVRGSFKMGLSAFVAMARGVSCPAALSCVVGRGLRNCGRGRAFIDHGRPVPKDQLMENRRQDADLLALERDVLVRDIRAQAQRAEAAKTARLRELRLAREATERASEKPVARKKPHP
jgi:hypothetical protein